MAFASTVKSTMGLGSGPAAVEDDFPIDINYAKLTAWLIDRRKVPEKWQEQVRLIRARIDEALKEMPDHPEITEMLKGSYIDYYECKRIMTILEQSQEGKLKNFFGQYTSTLLHNWDKVLRGYEKNNVYLGEASRTLLQYAGYDIPSMKKTINQGERKIVEINKKIQEYHKTIADYEKRLRDACEEYDIEGVNYRAELSALTTTIPALLTRLSEDAQKDEMRKAVEFYDVFRDFLKSYAEEDPAESSVPTKGKENKHSKNSGKNTGKKDKSGNKKKSNRTDADAGEKTFVGQSKGIEYAVEAETRPLATLRQLMDACIRVEPTLYGGTHTNGGEPDASISESHVDGDGGGNTIDWGFSMNMASATEGDGDKDVQAGVQNTTVDWGDSSETPVEIDWDISSADGGAGEGSSSQSAEEQSAGIDWGAADDSAVIDWGGSECSPEAAERKEGSREGEGSTENVAQGATASSALQLLSQSTFRLSLKHNLVELQAFFQHRLLELESNSTAAAVNQFNQAPELIQHSTSDTLKKFGKLVDELLLLLLDERLHQLLMMHSSERYLDRQVENFEQKVLHMEKLKDMIVKLEEKREELVEELAKTFPRLDECKKRTKRMQKEVEASMTKLCSRQVNIIGDINEY